MKRDTAAELADEIDSAGYTASVVHFSERGGVAGEPPERHGNPDDDLYGVRFYAYDMFIPEEIIEIVAGYDTQGIITRPDPGVVCPRPGE
jgi:hypothetical protein